MNGFRVLKNQELAEKAKTSTEKSIVADSPLADILKNPKKILDTLAQH